MRLIYNKGFTLVELVLSMIILGIIGTVSFMVIINPILGFNAAKQRSELVLIADNVLRKIDSEVKNALPNSIRVTNFGGVFYLEFVPIKSSGRYLSNPGSDAVVCPNDDASATDNNILSFDIQDTCFTTLGSIDNAVNVSNNDYVVLYNLGDNSNTTDFYVGGSGTGNNKAKITSISNLINSTKINIQANKFPNTSPGNRFFIVGTPISYICDPTTGTITKYWGYGINATQPTSITGNSALLAENITSCSFIYNSSLPNIRNGVLTSYLKISKNSNSIYLYGVSHVNNVP